MVSPQDSQLVPDSGAAPVEPTSPVLTLESSQLNHTTDPLNSTLSPPQKPTTTSAPGLLPKADVDPSLGGGSAESPTPSTNDELIRMFRTAVGINAHQYMGSVDNNPTKKPSGKTPYNSASDLEEARSGATGMYAQTLNKVRTLSWKYNILNSVLYACYFLQILIAASLTALGPGAGGHAVEITVLGAVNTIIAGTLALIKGQGLPERWRLDEHEFRRVRDFVEEQDALLVAGIIGHNRQQVGDLIEEAFKKYDLAQATEDNNKPQAYKRVRDWFTRRKAGRLRSRSTLGSNGVKSGSLNEKEDP